MHCPLLCALGKDPTITLLQEVLLLKAFMWKVHMNNV